MKQNEEKEVVLSYKEFIKVTKALKKCEKENELLREANKKLNNEIKEYNEKFTNSFKEN